MLVSVSYSLAGVGRVAGILQRDCGGDDALGQLLAHGGGRLSRGGWVRTDFSCIPLPPSVAFSLIMDGLPLFPPN